MFWILDLCLPRKEAASWKYSLKNNLNPTLGTKAINLSQVIDFVSSFWVSLENFKDELSPPPQTSPSISYHFRPE